MPEWVGRCSEDIVVYISFVQIRGISELLSAILRIREMNCGKYCFIISFGNCMNRVTACCINLIDICCPVALG